MLSQFCSGPGRNSQALLDLTKETSKFVTPYIADRYIAELRDPLNNRGTLIHTAFSALQLV